MDIKQSCKLLQNHIDIFMNNKPVPNGPSQTGNASGKGRGNNPPKK
ncbi:MAG: hypothetical protein SFY32_06870 [Bacteroidota bacterium]|nr:hypothetical protein [Bacteroidota bacterium]